MESYSYGSDMKGNMHYRTKNTNLTKRIGQARQRANYLRRRIKLRKNIRWNRVRLKLVERDIKWMLGSYQEA